MKSYETCPACGEILCHAGVSQRALADCVENHIFECPATLTGCVNNLRREWYVIRGELKNLAVVFWKWIRGRK